MLTTDHLKLFLARTFTLMHTVAELAQSQVLSIELKLDYKFDADGGIDSQTQSVTTSLDGPQTDSILESIDVVVKTESIRLGVANCLFSDPENTGSNFAFSSIKADLKDWPADLSSMWVNLTLNNHDTGLDAYLKVSITKGIPEYQITQLNQALWLPDTEMPLGEFMQGIFTRAEEASTDLTQAVLSKAATIANQ